MSERAETGPLAFGTDWPGVFIRGDDSKNYELHLAALLDYFEEKIRTAEELTEEDAMQLVHIELLRGLQSTLASSDVSNEAPVQHVKSWENV